MRKYVFLILIFFASILFSGCNPFDSKIKSGLQVMTGDETSSLFLDDQYLDKTPYINKEIKPGKYVLKIVPENQELSSYETVINLRKGLLTVVTWSLGKTPESSGGIVYEMEPVSNSEKSEISFITVPDNTIINFDNQEPQFAPILFQDLDPGHHEFEIKLPSYNTQKHTANILAGHRLIVYVKLAKNTQEPTDSQQQNSDEDSIQATQSSQIIPEVTITTLTASKDAEIEVENKKIIGKKVRILKTNFFQDGVEVLKIRDDSKQSGAEIGFAQVKKEYKFLEKSENNWYKIEFDDKKQGWVSGQYAELIEE